MRALFVPITWLLIGCGSRSGLDSARVTDASDASPPPSCPDSPSEPTPLATVGELASYQRVTAMTAVQGFVYYAVVNVSNNPVAIFRAPIGGGAPTAVILGASGCDSQSPFAYGDLVTDGRYLFTPDQEVVGCSGYAVHVTAYDTTNGALWTLPVPAGADPKPRVVSPQPLAGGGVAWVVDSGTYTGPTVVARWTGGPSSAVVATLPEMATDFVVAAGVGFASTIATGTLTLRRVSLADGAVTPLGEFGTEFSLLAANDEAIFYTPDGSALVRREVGSDATKTLGVPPPQRALWVDHDFLYLDSIGLSPPTSSPAVVTRLPASGGKTEEIFRDDDRQGIQAMTGDACNVYWVAGPDYNQQRPPTLFARRR